MSTKTSIKRIALVAVSALGFGLVTAIAPASATAATGTVTPIRVTFTGTAQDDVPVARLSWTSAAALDDDETFVLTLTSAPSAVAKVAILSAARAGAKMDVTSAGNGVADEFLANNTATLTGGAKTVASADIAMTANTTAGNAALGIIADTAGTYVGTLAVWDAGASAVNTVSFSFTTRGAASTVTLTSNATETSPSGAATLTVTVRDAAGNVTQPLSVDTVALADDNADVAGTFTDTSFAATGGTGTNTLYDGVATTTFTNSSVVGSLHNVTATPRGTMGGLTASTVSITVNSTTLTTTGITKFSVLTPADAAQNTGTDTDAAQKIRTGTSSVTILITGTASKTYRFSVVASAGTLNGATGTTTQYVNVATDADGEGTYTYTLGGAALLDTATSTVRLVDAVNANVGTNRIVVEQDDPVASTSTSTPNPSGAIVRAIGTSTSVTVTIRDQYSVALGAGYTINAYRGSTLLGTATTGSTGTAVVSVVNASTAVNNSSETYTYKYITPGTTGENTMSTTTVATYTTTGNITGMSAAITGVTGGGIITPILDTTTTSALTVIPAILIPADGTADDETGSEVYTKATGAVTGTGAAEMFIVTTTNTPGNTTTYTSSDGAFLCTLSAAAGGCAWDGGVTSVTRGATSAVRVFAQKSGLHTITATSGGKTTTIQFWAYNLETNYYTLTAAADKTTLVAGSNGVVTIDVKDIFGNIVNTADTLLTATAEGQVRLAGQALTQNMGTTSTGSFSFTVIADAAAGTGTVTIAPGTRAQAWAASYVKPTGAADPVRSVTLTFTVTAATAKTTDDAVAAAVAAEVEAKKATTEAAAATAAAKEATAAATKAATDAVAAAKAAQDAAVAAAQKAALDAVAAAKAAGDAAVAAAVKAALDAVAASKAAQDAAVAEAQAATEAAAEAIDASNAATDAANIAAEAADAATVAAEEARDAADAATAAVEELATQVSTLFAALKAQLTTLANTVAKIAKKVRA